MEVNRPTGTTAADTTPERRHERARPARPSWRHRTAGLSPIVVPNTQWPSADSTRLWRRGRPPSPTCRAGARGEGRQRPLGGARRHPTTADYLLDYLRMNSLWPLLSGLACCAMEMMSAATSVNDMDRFNMFPFRASPRQADVLIVAGTLTTKMAGPLVRLWEQMPEPKWCVAMGDCTCSGGRYKRSYATVQGIDRVCPSTCTCPAARRARRASSTACSSSSSSSWSAADTGPSAASAPPSRPASEAARYWTGLDHGHRAQRRLTERLGDQLLAPCGAPGHDRDHRRAG